MGTKKKKRVVKKVTKKAQKLANITITYKCSGGRCKPSPKRKHMQYGDTVTLKADNRDVEIRFDLASPFTDGSGFPANNPIQIASGNSVPKTVANVNGTFSYTFRCLNPLCPSSVDSPEMVVP